MLVLRKYKLWKKDGDILTPLLILWQIITDFGLDEVWKDSSLKRKWSDEKTDAEENETELSWKVALAVECLARKFDWKTAETNDREEVKDVNEVSQK